VAFGQPDPVEAPRLGVCRGGKGIVERLFLGLTFPVVTFHHQSDVHQGTSFHYRPTPMISPPLGPWPDCKLLIKALEKQGAIEPMILWAE
jgi:hypothetical protein